MKTKRRIIREMTVEMEDLRLRLLEKEHKIISLNEVVSGYLAREQAISQAMTEASATAQKLVSDANEQAGKILFDADEEVAAAKKEAEMLVDVAYQNARDIVKEANEQSRIRLEQTEAAIQSYGELLEQYNNVVKDSALQAEENSKRFSEYYKKLQLTMPELIGEAKNLTELLNENTDDLPDADDDPAQLMRNIYSIEHRVIPIEDGVAEADTVTIKNDTVEKTDEPEAEADEQTDAGALDKADEITDVVTQADDERIYTVKEVAPNMGDGDVELDSLIDKIIDLDNK